MRNKIYILFRNDDPCSLSDHKKERKILEIFESLGIPQVLAVIPKTVGDAHDCNLEEYHPLEENPQMISLLKEYESKGLIEIAQHGFTHQTNKNRPSLDSERTATEFYRGIDRKWLPNRPAYAGGYSEFSGLNIEEQRAKITQGKNYLEKIFRIKLETFIFPWNTYDRTSLEILKKAGFKFVPVEDDEMVVSGLCTIGCCHWDWQADLFLKTVNSIESTEPVFIQFAYHSWMLNDEELRIIVSLCKTLKLNPRIEFILPKDIPKKIPWSLEIIPLRTHLRQLAREINSYLDPKIEILSYYIADQKFYIKRILKASVGKFILKYLRPRTMLVAYLFLSVLLIPLFYLRYQKQMTNLMDIFILSLFIGIGVVYFKIQQRIKFSQ